MLTLSQAIDIVNNRRNLAELKALQNLEKLREDKIFSQMEIELRQLSFEIAKREALNADLGDLKERFTDCEIQFKKKIQELGYTPKDIKPRYFCKRCGDKGFIDGKRCVCLENLILNSIKSNCGKLETDIDDFNKIDFDIFGDAYKKGYKNTYKQLHKYAEKFPDVIPYLLLMGSTGTGKSFMCSVVSNVMMKKGYTVLFLNSCELNELFLKYHLADIALKGDIIYPVYQCDLLVIDDLGMENIYKNVTVPYLYSLIINRRQKHTIITTNLSHSQIAERYDFRISSRLMDKNLTINVPVLGEDLRLKKR
jgi:DNA replication protein DnaC